MTRNTYTIYGYIDIWLVLLILGSDPGRILEYPAHEHEQVPATDHVFAAPAISRRLNTASGTYNLHQRIYGDTLLLEVTHKRDGCLHRIPMAQPL